ncbi:hypothetical protein DB313_06140 (plasmid) [Borrelia turcica IST7]|uniref:Uncharacterized protein n=1 Tax=Borrelia turcica IST7 TaxID=1104446 RepID=A0A386PNR1_9SPIR|nr:hypothetical protein DB313_06140 [Borrelia turcica IST7]
MRQKIKEEKVRSQKFLRVTEDLTESAKRAQDEAYGIIDMLEELEKGIRDNNKDSNKEALNESLKSIIGKTIKLSQLIESQKKIEERKSLGYSKDKDFDVMFENIKDIKDKLKVLCSRVRSHLGGYKSTVTVDGLQTGAVTKAIGIVKLIHKTLAYINDNSKGSLPSILKDLEEEITTKNKI